MGSVWRPRLPILVAMPGANGVVGAALPLADNEAARPPIRAANDLDVPLRLPRLGSQQGDPLAALQNAVRYDVAGRASQLFRGSRPDATASGRMPACGDGLRALKEITVPTQSDVRRRATRRDAAPIVEGSAASLTGAWTWSDSSLVFQFDCLGGNRFEFYPVRHFDPDTGKETAFGRAHGTYAGAIAGCRLSGIYSVEAGIHPHRTAFSGEVVDGGRRMVLRKREPVCLPVLRGEESRHVFHRA